MPNPRTVFRILRVAGLIAIVALLLRSEWRFIHANLAGALNWRIQLYAVGSVLLLPHYWVALAITLVGHFGKRRIDKRAAKAAKEG